LKKRKKKREKRMTMKNLRISSCISTPFHFFFSIKKFNIAFYNK